jgi:arginase family enzyme
MRDIWSSPDTLSFLGAPRCEAKPVLLRKARARAAFFGAPVDTQGFPQRPGTVLGPKACREASAQYSGAATIEHGIDVRDYWGLVDCGDAALAGATVKQLHERIAQTAEAILAAGAIPIMCGGDHSIPIPGVQALARQSKARIGYLHIDSHLDTAESLAGSKNTMASPISRVVEVPGVSPENVVIFGARGLGNPPELVRRARKLGVRVIPMTEIIDRGVDAAITDALDTIWFNTDIVYVSLDNDALDPSVAPGTTAPEPGGITARELLRIAVAVGTRGVAMLDIAELSPNFDPSAITARLDCTWVVYVLSAYAAAIEAGKVGRPGGRRAAQSRQRQTGPGRRQAGRGR